MRLHVVSDVHGRADALAHAGDGADALVCLGDLLLFMDYADHSAGIMGGLFGPERVGEFIRLRTQRRFDAARDYSRSLWATLAGDRDEVIHAQMRRQYVDVLGALGSAGVPTYLTYGNVDVPPLLREVLAEQAPATVTLLDGETVDLDGHTLGLVGGGLQTPMRTPYEISDADYAAKLAAVGAVDVLCTHIPPQLPDLVYDTEAGRFERGSTALLAVVQETQPAWSVFGHVHQPLVREVTVGRTRCVNVGHFRATRAPFALDLDAA